MAHWRLHISKHEFNFFDLGGSRYQAANALYRRQSKGEDFEANQTRRTCSDHWSSTAIEMKGFFKNLQQALS